MNLSRLSNTASSVDSLDLCTLDYGSTVILTGRADYKNPLANETELQQLNRKVELFIG